MTAEDKAAVLSAASSGRRPVFKDLADCDFVVEAVVENLDVKTSALRRARLASASAGVILATNTSSISITKIAAATERPELVIGMHFMNPVPVMKLVEVIRGSTPPTRRPGNGHVALAEARLGKTRSSAGDFPGFISNRVLMPMINEAIYSRSTKASAMSRPSTRS